MRKILKIERRRLTIKTKVNDKENENEQKMLVLP